MLLVEHVYQTALLKLFQKAISMLSILILVSIVVHVQVLAQAKLLLQVKQGYTVDFNMKAETNWFPPFIFYYNYNLADYFTGIFSTRRM